MKNLKTFELGIGAIVVRFYLMMTVVIVAGFSGYWLVGLLALPIFLSIMLGVKITLPVRKSKETKVVSPLTTKKKWLDIA